MTHFNELNRKPAVLTGRPIFSTALEIVRPCFPQLNLIQAEVGEILRTGRVTNLCQKVPALEAALRSYLQVPHCVAVANGTLGLILALVGLKLEGDVIVPSFTFSATAHALWWAGLKPVFADIDPGSLTLDPRAVEAAITPHTSAILGVHVYGHPCDIDGLQQVARRHGLALLFDSAHAFGARYRGQAIGSFGDAEVFSFHATKILPMGEGGGITTPHDHLAEYLALALKFGDPGSQNSQFCGLNAKMQEFNAILGLENLKRVDQQIKNRRRYAGLLTERLGQLPGLRFQEIRPEVEVNFQNFAILVDQADFGLSRNALHRALAAEKILTRKYFCPPLHLHQAYGQYREKYRPALPVTEAAANQVLCLPLYSVMSAEMLDGICLAVESIHRHANEVRTISN